MPRHDFWGDQRKGCAQAANPTAGDVMAPISGDPRRSRHVVLTVFYNGDCPVCRARVTRYQAASAGRSRLLAWCDVARTPWALRRWGVDGDLARRRMHAVDVTGAIHGGAAAFARLWRELPGYRWLGHLISLPGIDLVAEGVYRLKLATSPALRATDSRTRRARHA